MPFNHDSLSFQAFGVCIAFDKAWHEGTRPKIEDFLTRVPEGEQASLLRELLAIELEMRRSSGEQPTVEQYATRFPEHTALLHEVLADPAGDTDSIALDAEHGTTKDAVGGLVATTLRLPGRDSDHIYTRKR